MNNASTRPPDPGNGPYSSMTTYDDDETEFLKAIQAHQRKTRNKFLPFSEILKVLKSLGYRKTSDDQQVADQRAEPELVPVVQAAPSGEGAVHQLPGPTPAGGHGDAV
jgi:hypothetical protein